MNQIAYVNGEFLPEDEARISIFDRGFLFGDGVYEVVPVIAGRLSNVAAHRERLTRSLGEIRLRPPISVEEIFTMLDTLKTRNSIEQGRVYMQVTRGPAERDFAFPKQPRPTLIAFARGEPGFDTAAARNGLRVMTVEDTRWSRRDIKTVMLLPGSMAKQHALDNGFDDAWLVTDGQVNEGTSNNAYIVLNGTIRTRPLSNDILGGCTRRALLQLARDQDLTIDETAFSVTDAKRADEAFITSATSFVTPVVQIDEQVIGDGEPGPMAKRLRSILLAHARLQAEAESETETEAGN